MHWSQKRSNLQLLLSKRYKNLLVKINGIELLGSNQAYINLLVY